MARLSSIQVCQSINQSHTGLDLRVPVILACSCGIVWCCSTHH